MAWPGSEPAGICEEHCEKALATAAALGFHLQLQPLEPETWPKRTAIVVHSDKEAMWTLGEKLGLQGEALMLFRHALAELAIPVMVAEDGTVTMLFLIPEEARTS
jgi:hypothetical protein